MEKAYKIVEAMDMDNVGQLSMKNAGAVFNSVSLPQSDATFMYAFWLIINIPSVAFGTYRGYKAEKITVPVRTSRIERDIPKTS